MLGKSVVVATGKTALNMLTDVWKKAVTVKSQLTGSPPPVFTPPRLESTQVKQSWTQSGQEFQWNVDRQDSEKFPGTRYNRILKNLQASGVKPLDVSVDYVMSFPVLKYAKELENIIKVVGN